MIAQNEINVQEDLANKPDNHAVSLKQSRTGRILIQFK